MAAGLKVLNNCKPEWVPKGTKHDNRSVTSNSTATTNNASTASTITSVSFLQTGSKTPEVKYLRGINNYFFKNITCRIFGMNGHYQTHCPVVNSHRHTFGESSNPNSSISDTSSNTSVSNAKASAQEVSVARVSGVILNQSFSSYLNPNWVLLDCESTDHIFCNKDLLTDVNQTTDGEYLRLYTSGGLIDSHSK